MKQLSKRFLSLLLAVSLLAGLAVPGMAAEDDPTSEQLSFREANDFNTTSDLLEPVQEPETQNLYEATDIVRVSIVLEEKSTLEVGYSTLNIAENAQAMAYRQELQNDQEVMTAKIEAAIGETLDVRWNLTLAANIISANVAYGDLDAIRGLSGVKEVVLEARYEPCVLDQEETYDPNMITSGDMIGTTAAWESGYTGAGTRIAVIDTGLDTDHQSFDAEAYWYSLAYQAGRADMELDAYLESLNLLTADEIAQKLDQLNVKGKAEELYRSGKIVFGYNYVDGTMEITHLEDDQGEHGSHVSGIATANAYLNNGDGTFTSVQDDVKVQGVAPDAQILVMKVFGSSGGAYDSDYMAAIEDAIVLNADSINLSLGSIYAGFTRNDTYADLLDSLTESDTVVCISASNNGNWADQAKHGNAGYLYADDVNMSTAGSPGTYTNSLDVASVDNIGLTDYYMHFGETGITYTEVLYDNLPLYTLVGEHEYILIEGVGTEEDFEALGEALEGKIVFCHRGETSFYQKADAAVEHGAIATVIINNTAGNINMDLTDYSYTDPCVSITQENGAWVQSVSTPVTDENGQVLYYTGKLTITGQLDTQVSQDANYTMSYFSSWGVPSDLTMKPEITAPGGNIYSVNGKHQVDGGYLGGSDQYENMSGTSMAAPQVSGMAALVAQYIRQEGLDEQTGLTVRALAQSLLMSTAEPLKEDADHYYSVLQQGSGLADVSAATAAQSYILMGSDATESYADGKVKVELGDDPAKNGVYSFGFTLNNLTDTQQQYLLSADLFTQGLMEVEGVSYLDTQTDALQAAITWTVNGEVLEPASDLTQMDFNGDRLVNTDDVQAIVDNVAGIREGLTNAELADLNDDGSITTYDAWLLLRQLSSGIVTLPAGGSVEIQVSVALTESQKEALNANYPSGAYLEGYFFAKQFSTAEGELGVTHSIPLLGFYGNWSEASMFDKTTFVDSLYGDTTATYLGSTRINALAIKYPGDSTGYYFVGNPYMVEEEYPEERAAISSGSTLYQYQISLIRNAGAVMAVITNEAGEILYTGPVQDQVNAAYYYSGYAAWLDTAIAYAMNKKVSTLNVEEGDRITVTLVAVPEYYEEDGALTADQIKQLMADNTLGEGAYLSTSMTIDNTAPTISSITKDFVTGNLTVVAQDNQYISMVSIQDRSGNELTDAIVPEQTEAGQVTSATFDLEGITIGETCYIVVADYADNQTVYEVEYGGEPEDYSGNFYAFTSSTYRGSGQRWLEIDPETLYYRNSSDYGGTKTVSNMDLEILAAEYVDGYVYMAADDGYLYVAKQGLWDEYEPAGYYGGIFDKVYDMAYNYADGKLYCMGSDSTVYSIGLIDGEFTKEFTVTIDHPSSSSSYKWLSRLAIDDEGTFYSVNNSPASYTYLYKWTKEDIMDGQVTDVPYIGRVRHANYDYIGALAWDHDKDVLYFANAYSASGSSSCLLLQINLETGEGTKVNTTYAGENDPSTYGSRLQCSTAGLYIVPTESKGIAPVTEATKISLDTTETTIWKGQTITVRPSVYPWTLTDKSVTWQSSDESIVTVENGWVTGVGVGTATVTATTVAEPHLTASCVVTVEKLDTMDLKGLVYDQNGKAYWAEFTSDDPAAWKTVSDETASFIAGGLMDETIYVHNGKELYGVDADDFTATSYGEIASTWIWSDATYAPLTEEGLFGDFMALANNGTLLETVDAQAGEVDYWDLSSYFAEDPMAAITYYRSGVEDYSTILPSYVKYFDCPTQYYYMLTESGMLHEISILTYDRGGTYVLNYQEVGQLELDLSGVAAVTEGRTASMIYDEASGWLVLSVCMGDEGSNLYAIDPETLVVVNLGSYGENGEKMVSLYQYDRATQLSVRLNKTEASFYAGDTLQLSAKVKPETYSQNVTWTSSESSIATVDENGVVTGLKAGEVTITATSVDTNEAGQTASASCAVTVKAVFDLDTKLNAQIVTEDGTQWVTIDTSDMSVQVNAAATTTLTGAGMHDGKFYGSDSDLSSNGTIYQVDPETGYTEKTGTACPVDYAVLDLTQAPAMEYTVKGETSIVFDFPLYLANDQGFYFLRNYEEADFWGYGDSSYSDQGAIAYVGFIYERSYGTQHLFYVLGANGNIYRIKIGPTYRMRRDVLGKIDMRFFDYTGLTMDYYNDGTNEGLVVGYNNESTGKAELYYIDLVDDALTCCKLGNVPGASAISGLTLATEQQYETHAASSEVTQGEGVFQSSTVALAEPLCLYQDPIRLGSSLETASVNTVAAPASTGTITNGEDTVIVEVTAKNAQGADIASTNGLVTVTYDAQALTLESVLVSADFRAVVTEEGSVLFAYANTAEIAAGEAVATLTFQVNATENTTVAVNHSQVNDQLPAFVETLDVTFEHANTEVRNAKEKTCTEDGYSGDIYCVDCGKLLLAGEAVPAYCASAAYSDLNTNAWYHESIDYVLKTGLMRGVGDGRFDPDGEMTRAQLVTVLYRMAGSPTVETGNTFEDVMAGAWYAKAVAWAYANGITKGKTDTLFAPDEPVTREQMVTFFSRFAKLNGENVTADGDLSDFTDAALVSNYAKSTMAWAVQIGLIRGMGDNTIAPKTTATRAQVAAILMRYCETFGD